MGNCHRKASNNHPINTKTKSSMTEEPCRPTTVAGGRSYQGGDTTLPEPVPSRGQIVTPNLKIFTYAELRGATKNFRPNSIVGEGGFGQVYKGWVDGVTYAPSKAAGVGIPVAVKKSDSGSFQGLKEWQAEVEFLGKFSHPNLVKLLGYCWQDQEFLLVYEYMQKGSLEKHLFKKDTEPLSWETRMKIAMGAAQGLAFLHTTERKVIYRDFKPSNILLDGKSTIKDTGPHIFSTIGAPENIKPIPVVLKTINKEFNAKLSDFGLAKLGPVNGESHVSTMIVGTYGYAAPEYMITGHLYVKSDIYGFGVVMLEMITGLRVLDPNRPPSQKNLVDWARPFLTDIKKLQTIMDPRLEQLYPSQGAIKAGELIFRCLDLNPNYRPSMEKVVVSLQEINAIRMKPKRLSINSRQLTTQHHEQMYDNHRHKNYHRPPLHTRQRGAWVDRSPVRVFK